MGMEFIDTIPSTNCAEWRCEYCGTEYVSAGRPKCTVCPAVIEAVCEWREADKLAQSLALERGDRQLDRWYTAACERAVKVDALRVAADALAAPTPSAETE